MTKQESCAQIDVENQRTLLDKHLYIETRRYATPHAHFKKPLTNFRETI
jgi:hypothetical protein